MPYLGLDVGGTRCRHAWRPEGIGAPGDGPGTQAAVHGASAAAEILARYLTGLPGPTPDHTVVAIAGAGDPELARELAGGIRAAGWQGPLTVVGDLVAAAAGALADGPGVVVYAGTGSFAIARGANGDLARVGGRGYLLDDAGSGYDIVRRAAAAVVAAADGLGPTTALAAPLVAAFRAPGPERLGVALQRLPTGDVASRLPLVLEAAAGGDDVARAILETAGSELARLALAAAARARLAGEDLFVAIGGGVLQAAGPVSESLTRGLRQAGTRPPASCGPRSAAEGAARLAEAAALGLQPLQSWVQRGLV